MPHGRWIFPTVLILLVLSIVGVVAQRAGRRHEKGESARPGTRSDRLYLRGVTYTSSSAGKRLFTLTADEIIHRKRKVGPLTLNPVKEIEMTGVLITVYREARNASAAQSPLDEPLLPIREILEESLAAKGLGFVSRVIIKGLDLSVLRDAGRLFRIQAGTATAALESPVVRLADGVTLSTGAGEEIATRRAEWRGDTMRLSIPGSYVLRGGAGALEGKTAIFTVNPDGSLTRD